MKKIEQREDISLLVNQFYGKIREDELLGPIFNQHIKEEEWPMHLEKLTDFWEANLLGTAKFKGSPTQKHVNVDKKLGYTIEPAHFGRWIQLWFETIDALYKGQHAEKAKNAARRMSTGQYLFIWQQRPENKKETNL